MSDVCLRVLTRACTRALLLSVAEGRYDRLMSEDNGMEFWSTSILRVFQVLLCLSCAYLRFFRANLFFGKLKGVLVNFCLACILGYCASLSLSLSLSLCVCVCVQAPVACIAIVLPDVRVFNIWDGSVFHLICTPWA